MRLEEGRIKVSRILVDSIIDRQGLVQCGDVILQGWAADRQSVRAGYSKENLGLMLRGYTLLTVVPLLLLPHRMEFNP